MVGQGSSAAYKQPPLPLLLASCPPWPGALAHDHIVPCTTQLTSLRALNCYPWAPAHAAHTYLPGSRPCCVCCRRDSSCKPPLPFLLPVKDSVDDVCVSTQAGSPHGDQSVKIPVGITRLFQSQLDWNLYSSKQPQLNHRQVRSKLLSPSAACSTSPLHMSKSRKVTCRSSTPHCSPSEAHIAWSRGHRYLRNYCTGHKQTTAPRAACKDPGSLRLWCGLTSSRNL